MLESRNLNENVSVPLDKEAAESNSWRKTSPGRAKHWRYQPKRNKSQWPAVDGAAAPDSIPAPQSSPDTQALPNTDSPPVSKSKFWKKKTHLRGHRGKKDRSHSPGAAPTDTAATASTADAAASAHEEARNDRLCLHSESQHRPSALDATISRRDSPASPDCISQLSQFDDSELDFEFGIDDTIAFPVTASMDHAHKSDPQNLGNEQKHYASSAHALDNLAHDFQKSMDISHDTTCTTADSYNVVTTNAAGAAILDTLSYRHNLALQTQLPTPTEEIIAGAYSESPSPTMLKISAVSSQEMNYGPGQGETSIFSAGPSFLQIPPNPGFWQSQTAGDSMFIPQQNPYPLPYGPIPSGYGPYMMPPPLPSSPFYMDALGINHPSNPIPFYSPPTPPPPSPPIQYQQVMVGGTVFFTPVYSLDTMDNAAMTLSPQSPVDRNSSISSMGNPSNRNIPSQGPKKKKKKNSRKSMVRKEDAGYQ
jgi:hypothetical protein